MSIGIADLQAGIWSLWSDSGLDTTFKDYWNDDELPTGATEANYPTLNDLQAVPAQPMFPYCVLECKDGVDKTRMSVDGSFKKKIRDVEVTFNVHTKDSANSTTSAKQDCADLMEEIMKVFGGHPEEGPQQIGLSHGGTIPTQFISDNIVQRELYHFQGILRYLIRLDLPYAIR